MRELAARAYFTLCRVVGRLLRASRYATTYVVIENGEPSVRKRRRSYAPLLVRLGGPLVRLLDTGVRILPQRDWEERERLMYETLHGASIRVDADGTLVLPLLEGETLASVLEDPKLSESVRTTAIELAVVALAELHARGLTHADAMAENVLVDLEAGVAHWFDFETVHTASHPMEWRRADDVRALLATCLVRTAPEKRAETLRLILDLYRADEVIPVLSAIFTSVFRRPLPFHLGQAPLSFESFREIDRLLTGQEARQAAYSR